MTNSAFRISGLQPEVVLFDAGGTLVLIDPDRFNHFTARWDRPAVDPNLLSNAHFQAMADFATRLTAGEELQFRWWVERFFELAGVVLSADMARSFEGGKGMWNHPIPGARETVQGIQARGYRVAVVSNSDGSVADALEIAGFAGMFEVIIDSTNVGISKPDPAIFEVALEALDVPAGWAWYVGDSHYHDVGGARAAGLAGSVLIDPLGVAPNGQLAVRAIAELEDLLP